MAGQQPDPPPPAKGTSAVWDFLIALFFYAGAVFMYYYLAHLERSGESTSMNVIVVWLYQLGGKALVSLIFVFFGTGLLIMGIMKLVKPRS
jgi:hypothetical protein